MNLFARALVELAVSFICITTAVILLYMTFLHENSAWQNKIQQLISSKANTAATNIVDLFTSKDFLGLVWGCITVSIGEVGTKLSQIAKFTTLNWAYFGGAILLLIIAFYRTLKLSLAIGLQEEYGKTNLV